MSVEDYADGSEEVLWIGTVTLAAMNIDRTGVRDIPSIIIQIETDRERITRDLNKSRIHERFAIIIRYDARRLIALDNDRAVRGIGDLGRPRIAGNSSRVMGLWRNDADCAVIDESLAYVE